MFEEDIREAIIKIVDAMPDIHGLAIAYQLESKRVNRFRVAAILKQMTDEGILRRVEIPDSSYFRYWLQR
jgi:hypothetical protein